MFEKGELIQYGTNGVCEIVDITTPKISGIPKGKLYYELQPYYKKDGKIFTPIDNKKVLMRKILTKKEAQELIDGIPEIEALYIENDKMREMQYKECIRSGDCREWIRIIKTLYLRKMKRIAQGKHITATDERYLKLAEESLYSELSISLAIPKEGMEKYISNQIEKNKK